MGVSFCAIDFETANSYRGSPCAVAAVRVEDERVAACATWLMRPPVGVDEFDPWNVALHGITPAMVRGEPRFADRLPELVAFIGDLPVVAHNAAFDIGVVRDACVASDLPWPRLSYACSLVLARRTYELLSYSLPWVADAAGHSLDRHHDPAADALACASITLDIAARLGVASLRDLVESRRCAMGELSADEWSGCHHRGDVAARHVPNVDADPSHPFYGREMVFTGALATMTRSRAWELVAHRGGTPAEGVTRQTDILVVGYQDARRLRPGEALSAKARKAADLRAKGQPIEVVPETDFVQLLEL